MLHFRKYIHRDIKPENILIDIEERLLEDLKIE